MSRLRDNLYRMSRTEWNNLAKNQYCDDEIQTWIANNGHVQARYYLASNPNICDGAINVLLAGKSNIAKALMVSSGRVTSPNTIKEVYNVAARRLDSWRINGLFVRSWQYGTITATPGDILDDIYERFCKGKESVGWASGRHLPMSLAEHPNCTIKLAIQLSQAQDSRIASVGRDALVRATRKQKRTEIHK